MAEKKEIKRLTIADIKKLKNYENVSDEHAQEIVYSIRNLAVLFYEHLNRKKNEIEQEKLNVEEGKTANKRK